MIHSRLCRKCHKPFSHGNNYEICPDCRLKKDKKNSLSACSSCFAEEGQFHEEGCVREKCVKCKCPRVYCNCKTYSEKEPFFEICWCCNRCGKNYPNGIMVSRGEWLFLCGATYNQKDYLCEKCMIIIKNLREKNANCNK